MKYLLSLFAVPLVFPLAFASSSHDYLVKLAKEGSGVIKLNSSTFNLLTSDSRTWSAAVHLTALDSKRKCLPCKEFNPSFAAVARAWSEVPLEHRDSHFFATLDFDEDGQDVFHKLSMQSAPAVLVYPATQGSHASMRTLPYKYDFSYGFDPAPLAESLSKHTPIIIPYRDPIKWAKYINLSLVTFGLISAVHFLSPIIRIRWTWAISTIATSLIMTSGFMFTKIRGSPATGPDGNWISNGYQNQYSKEVLVIFITYSLLAIAVLMLVIITPFQKSPRRQRFQIYLWIGVFGLVYSGLISLFRIKNRGYPFKLIL